MAYLFILIMVALIVGLFVLAAKEEPKRMTAPGRSGSIRCPTCGADARAQGGWWECGWCGDSGRCG